MFEAIYHNELSVKLGFCLPVICGRGPKIKDFLMKSMKAAPFVADIQCGLAFWSFFVVQK
jgi:hypothetical protein